MKEYFKIKSDNLTRFDKLVLTPLGLVLLISVLFLSRSVLYVKESKEGLSDSKSENNIVICTVIGFRTKANKNKFKYLVKGKRYETYHRHTFPLIIGEKYLGRYLLTDPEICFVDITHPIIDSTMFSRTTCRVIKVDTSTFNKNFVVFTYSINKKNYKREVYIKNHNSFIEDNNYAILYNKVYPKISYIINNN